MAKYHGKSGAVYLSTSGASAAIPVINISEWSLDMPKDSVEVTTFGDVNKTKVKGLPDIKGKLSGYWNDADETLFTAAESTTAVNVYLYQSTNAISKYFYGTAWLDVSISNSVKDAVKVTANFDAAGTWGRK